MSNFKSRTCDRLGAAPFKRSHVIGSANSTHVTDFEGPLFRSFPHGLSMETSDIRAMPPVIGGMNSQKSFSRGDSPTLRGLTPYVASMQTQPPHLLKKKQLATVLGISPRTVDDLVAKRAIPYLAISPRLHLFDPEAVKFALAKRFEVRAKGVLA